LSLEQVDELYENVHKAWKSKDFVPKLSYADFEKRSPDWSSTGLDGATPSKSPVESSTIHFEEIV
jgi:hypothetical protein